MMGPLIAKANPDELLGEQGSNLVSPFDCCYAALLEIFFKTEFVYLLLG